MALGLKSIFKFMTCLIFNDSINSGLPNQTDTFINTSLPNKISFCINASSFN